MSGFFIVTRNTCHYGLRRVNNIITVISEVTMCVERLAVLIFCHISGKYVSDSVHPWHLYCAPRHRLPRLRALLPISEMVGVRRLYWWETVSSDHRSYSISHQILLACHVILMVKCGLRCRYNLQVEYCRYFESTFEITCCTAA